MSLKPSPTKALDALAAALVVIITVPAFASALVRHEWSPSAGWNVEHLLEGYVGLVSLRGPLSSNTKFTIETQLFAVPVGYDSPPQAAKWYRKLAEQDSFLHQVELGKMYEQGVGVLQDYAEAAKWYRKAAKLGLADAQARLGIMYEIGRGIPQDYVLAHMWFNLAAAQMSPGKARDDAAKSRDRVAARMSPVQIAEAQRLAREWKPKEP